MSNVELTKAERCMVPTLGVTRTNGLTLRDAKRAARRIAIATRDHRHPCETFVDSDEMTPGRYTLTVRNW